jgi:MraZ protein
MVINRFRGSYEHTIDEKGRLSFPSRFRETLRQYHSEVLIAIPWDMHLRIYPLSEWENVENRLMTENGRQTEDLDRIIRYFQSESRECVLDRQGRILLPPVLRAELGLKKDIVLIGMIERVEIWDKAVWLVERQVGRDHFEAEKEGIKKRGIL